MKTRLVLAGKSKAEIVQATALAMNKKELPVLEVGAMCYMLSKHQFLTDQGMNWHPHLMFFIPGDTAKSWGANLPGSPVLASDRSGRARNDHDDGPGRHMVPTERPPRRWSIGKLSGGAGSFALRLTKAQSSQSGIRKTS